MTDVFSELAQERADEIKRGQERQRQRAAERARQRELDEAWARAIRSCDAESFRALGRLLSANGQADYLPAIAETRRKAKAAGDVFAVAELFILECLRLAADPKATTAKLGEALTTARGLWPDELPEHVEAIRGFIEVRHQHGGKLPKEPAEPEARRATAEPEEPGEGVAPRNRWALKQYDARGAETYHKPAQVWRKWQNMTQEARAAICPDSPGKVTKAAIEQGIKRARLARDGNAKRKRTTREKR